MKSAAELAISNKLYAEQSYVSDLRVYFIVTEKEFRQLLSLRESQETFQTIPPKVEFPQGSETRKVQRPQHFDLISCQIQNF